MLQRDGEFNWGALSADRRVRDDATARWCWSARSRAIRCATFARRSTCPTSPPTRAIADFAGQFAHKTELQAMFRERFAQQHDRALARAARRAGSAVRAGADAGRGAAITSRPAPTTASSDSSPTASGPKLVGSPLTHGRGRLPRAPSAAAARRRRRGDAARSRAIGRAHRGAQGGRDRRVNVRYRAARITSRG